MTGKEIPAQTAPAIAHLGSATHQSAERTTQDGCEARQDSGSAPYQEQRSNANVQTNPDATCHLDRCPVVTLELNPDGSLVELAPGDWFVCFVPGIDKQWWHPFVNKRHKHVFAMRPVGDGKWTLFEPWWTRLLTATISSVQARKFLRWGAEGDVLLVREAIPGSGGQVRGWMNCAALAAYLLGRPYWVWTPHGLYRRLLREPNVCRIDVSALLQDDLSKLGSETARDVLACDECRPDHRKRRPGAQKPFCMNCGRDLSAPHATQANAKP